MKLLGLHLIYQGFIKFMENYSSWKMYLQAKILTLYIFIHMLPPSRPPAPQFPLCNYNSSPGSTITPQAKMTWNIKLFIFNIISNIFKCDYLTVLSIKYLSYSIVVMLLCFPLQPQLDSKVIPNRKVNLITGSFYCQVQCWKCITNEK